MKSIAVIGLGRFGSRIARKLAQSGQDVVAIDKNRDVVEVIRDGVAQALAMDATDEQALRDRGVHTVDVAVIAIGQDFEATVLATVTLKQLGVKRLIARARSRTSADVLQRVGADAVVMPEDEAADRWANRLIGPAVLNQIEFHEGYSIVELPMPRPWAGKSLSQLEVRPKYGVHVVAVKRRSTERGQTARIEVPGPEDPLGEHDVVILMGRDEDLTKLPTV